MRNVFLVLACIAILLVAAQRVLRAFEGEEESIQRRFQTMAAGFNSTTMRHALGGFDPDFRDEGTRYDKQIVRRVLASMFFTEKDELTRSFPYRVEIPAEELQVELDESDPNLARVQVHAVFHHTVRGEEELYWDLRFHGEMRKSEGRWRLWRTREVNHADRRDSREL